MPTTGLVSIKEACALLKISPDTLARWRKSGKIQATNLNGTNLIRIPMSEIDRIIKEGYEEVSDDEF